jgi:UDP-N-acetylmuramyl pentapeptide synthase
MAVDFKDLTLEDLLKGLPHLVVEGMQGRYIYNLEFAEVDGTRIVADKYYVILDNGQVEWGQGHSEDPEATLFTVNQGGVDTLIAFQVHGLKAATSAMILGYIFASNIKKAEAWFKVLKIGLEPVKAAMAAMSHTHSMTW